LLITRPFFQESHKYIPNKPLTLITKNFFALYENPIASFIISFIIFFGIALIIKVWSLTTPGNYYSYLADAFIHGQLNLRLQPSELLDLSFYQGKIYLYWPPLPAVLSIPIVLIFGVNFSDVVFTIVIGSLNTAIIARLLRNCNYRGILNLTNVQRGLLVFAFGFGSAQLPLVLFAGV
jgi:hypothetical protein